MSRFPDYKNNILYISSSDNEECEEKVDIKITQSLLSFWCSISIPSLHVLYYTRAAFSSLISMGILPLQ